MSVDESLMCSFQVESSAFLFYRYTDAALCAVSAVYFTIPSRLSDPEAVREKSKVPVRRGEFRTPHHPASHRSGTEKKVSGWPWLSCSYPSWSLALVPAGCLKHSSLLSVSLFVCKQKIQECFFCLFVGISMNVSGISFFFPPFLFEAMICITQPSLLLVSPFSNIETNLLWNWQDVKKRCFPAFRLTVSIVILWMHARLWDWDGFFALADVKFIDCPRQQGQIFPVSA